MAILNEHGQRPFLLNIDQDTAYEFKFRKPFTETIDVIEFICETNDESKVRYSISHSFDDVNYSPYTTNILDSLTYIQQHRETGGFKEVFIKCKVIFDFNDEHDFYRLICIKIDGEIQDPTTFLVSEVQNYRGITNAYTKNLFKPYANLETSIDRMLAQANKINEMFGHEVFYIKVKEIEESFNSTFKTFEKFKAEEIKKCNILIPDNDFKANQLVYSEWAIEYEEDLKIHVVIEEFQRAFGFGADPQAKDIVYIPAIGRMYDVVASTTQLQLGLVPVYYECALRKHVAMTDTDTNSVLNPDGFDVNQALTFEINDFEHGLSDSPDSVDNNSPLLKIDDDNAQTTGKIISDANVEGLDAQALQDYYFLSKHEVMRKVTHKSLEVINQPLNINGSPIFFRYYNGEYVRGKQVAIQYNRTKMVNPSKQFNVSLWFKSDKTEHNIYSFYTLLIRRNGERLEAFDMVKNEVVSYIDYRNDDLWSFLNLNIDLSTMQVNWQLYEYDHIDVQMNLIKEEFFKQSLIKVNKYFDNFLVYGGMLFSNIKVYAKPIENDDVIGLAVDRSFKIENSVLIDTVFDIKKPQN